MHGAANVDKNPRSGSSQVPATNLLLLLLLNGHDIQLISQFLLPYPQLGAALRSHQRSFFLWMPDYQCIDSQLVRV